MDKKLQEKKKYLDLADKVVSRLSGETVDEQTLISLLKSIEPYHYEEIIEERFVSKLCGYSCCGNELTNIPTKKYQISTRFNKVYELSDRKRYCSVECYKSSKYLEAQISTTPVWMRHTPEYLKGEGANEIKLWSSTIKKPSKKKSNITDIDKNESKIQSTISTSQITNNQPNKNENISKLLSLEIESELKQIENEWNSKFRISETLPLQEIQLVDQIKIQKENIELKDEMLDTLQERSELLKKKFIESMEIHKKPSDLTILKNVFLFKILNESEIIELGVGDVEFKIDQKSLSQLLLIEYIVQRINELLTSRTKAYLLENESNSGPTINEEREREEYIEMCDKFVAKKSAFFSDIDYQESYANFNFKPDLKCNPDDNGEKEMIAKLKGFEDLFQTDSTENAKEEQVYKDDDQLDSEARKPIPDYEKLKKEAIQQQLKIKEFFMGSSKTKNKEATVIDENDINEYNQNMIIKIKETNEEIVRVLPKVDSKSQTGIRRNIFYEKLIKYLEQLLKFSEFNYSAISNSLKNHVKNFVFSLSMSLKASQTNKTFETLVKNDKLIETILTSFKLDQVKLESICYYLIRN